VRRLIRLVLPVLFGLQFSPPAGAAGEPAIRGYSDYAELARRVQALEGRDGVSVRSLAKTVGGRDVWLVAIGEEDVAGKPAICIVGNTVAGHLVGSEIALGVAEAIAGSGDEGTKALLERATLYVIPRPNPDGSERFFEAPYFEVDGNGRKTDDDRDFSFGEDPPEDLNRDGFITQMRVADPLGDQVPHPDDPRVLVAADPKRGERGAYRVYLEGVDNDKDEQWNEDPGAGVSFNRNFPAKYPYFGEHAGENAVSEAETRAVADFFFDHPNIAVVLCFSPEDNLFHPWKPASDAASQKVKTSIQPEDAPHFDEIAKRYRELHGGKEPPPSPAGAGSFSDWAYLQYGRWTFAARGWWIPPKPQEKKKDEAEGEAVESKPEAAKEDEPKEGADSKSDDQEKKKPDERAKELRRALEWFRENDVPGFSDWTPFEHPDFPGKRVEIGGVRPFFLLNPPFEQVPPLVDKHVQFVRFLSERLPRLAVHDVKSERAGEGVYRLTLRVANEGALPTMSRMGQIAKIPFPLNWELEIPEGGKLLSGTRRGQVEVLEGSGGNAQLEWLLLAPGANPKVAFAVRGPSSGAARREIDLAGN
jgi:hypothetical protein